MGYIYVIPILACPFVLFISFFLFSKNFFYIFVSFKMAESNHEWNKVAETEQAAETKRDWSKVVETKQAWRKVAERKQDWTLDSERKQDWIQTIESEPSWNKVIESEQDWNKVAESEQDWNMVLAERSIVNLERVDSWCKVTDNNNNNSSGEDDGASNTELETLENGNNSVQQEGFGKKNSLSHQNTNQNATDSEVELANVQLAEDLGIDPAVFQVEERERNPDAVSTGLWVLAGGVLGYVTYHLARKASEPLMELLQPSL